MNTTKYRLCACGCGETIGPLTPSRAHYRHKSAHRFRTTPNIIGVPSGCWEWIESTAYGYARDFSHRLSYQIFVGPLIEGLELDHLCKNTKCVNPEHLEQVSHRTNIRRRDFTKLNINDARFIRSAYAIKQWTNKSLAPWFGLDPSAISRIVTHDIWREDN